MTVSMCLRCCVLDDNIALHMGAILDLQADIDRLANDGVFHVDATTDTEIEKTRLPPWARKLRLVPIDGTLAIRFTPVRGGTKLEIRYAIDFAALPPLPFAPKRAIDWLFFIAGPLVCSATVPAAPLRAADVLGGSLVATS